MRIKKSKVIRDKRDPGDMFRVRFPKGEISLDFYNLTRAKEHTRVDNVIEGPVNEQRSPLVRLNSNMAT